MSSPDAETDAPREARATAAERSGMPLAALGVLAFSFSTPMTKLAVRHLDVVLAGMGRAVPPAIVGAALLRATRQRLPSGDQIKRLVFVGVGVVIGFPLLTAWALHRVPAAHGSLAIGAAPLATAGFGMVLARERPSVRYWAASAMAVAAVLAYVIEVGGGTVKPADGVLLVAVVLVGLGYAHGGLLGRELGGWQVICWALVLALPVTVPVSVARLMVADLHGVSASAWAGWAYTAGVSMFLGFFAWYGGLARAGIARAGQLQLVQPVLALVWGWPLLGEDLDASAMVCALIVIAAVAWGRRAPIRVDWRQRR